MKKIMRLYLDVIGIVITSTLGLCARNIDLMFVVDGSGSVRVKGFEIVKKWIIEVAKGFDIAEEVQIGVVQYSHWYENRERYRNKWIETEIALGQYHDQDSFSQAVENIEYHGYTTYTAQAIRKTVLEDFNGPTGRFPNAVRVMILITDGNATDSKVLPSAVKLARKARVDAIAVGVNLYNLTQLQLIAGSDERVFEVDTFDELLDTAPGIVKSLLNFTTCVPGENGGVDNSLIFSLAGVATFVCVLFIASGTLILRKRRKKAKRLKIIQKKIQQRRLPIPIPDQDMLSNYRIYESIRWKPEENTPFADTQLSSEAEELKLDSHNSISNVSISQERYIVRSNCQDAKTDEGRGTGRLEPGIEEIPYHDDSILRSPDKLELKRISDFNKHVIDKVCESKFICNLGTQESPPIPRDILHLAIEATDRSLYNSNLSRQYSIGAIYDSMVLAAGYDRYAGYETPTHWRIKQGVHSNPTGDEENYIMSPQTSKHHAAMNRKHPYAGIGRVGMMRYPEQNEYLILDDNESLLRAIPTLRSQPKDERRKSIVKRYSYP